MNNEFFRILLVEDDPAHSTLFQYQLVKSGLAHELVHATELEEATELLCQTTFDVIVTDIGLPDEDGPEVVRTLTRLAPDTAVIVLTADSRDITEEKVFELGAQDYIPKETASADRFAFTLRHAVRRQRLRSEHRRMREELQRQKCELALKNENLAVLLETTHRFVDNVSHDFRTPLTVIREYTSLMRDEHMGLLNDDQVEFLDIIADRADDLSIMVDDMLDSSRMEAGLLAMSRVAVDPLAIINRVRSGLQRKAECKGARLVVECDEQVPVVFCDPEKAGRTLTNLVANAIKFCGDPGCVEIGIRHLPEAKEVELTVTDNGNGIAPEDIRLLGQRFRQVGSVSRTSSNGSGLGLNIASELAALNLGRMWVRSQLNEGSTFGFSLPVCDVTEVVKRFLAITTPAGTDHTVHTATGHTSDSRHFRFEAAGRNRPDDPGAMVLWLEASIAECDDLKTMREIDALWRYIQRPADLVMRNGESSWLLLCPGHAQKRTAIIQRLVDEYAARERNRPNGKLPELKVNYRGAFRVPDDSDELIQRVSFTEQTVCSGRGWPREEARTELI